MRDEKLIDQVNLKTISRNDNDHRVLGVRNLPPSRVESLDYLRGLLAVSVMIYHYVAWSGVELGADTVLGRLGIYSVSTFYILSGLSLGLVYRGRINNM